ncbi:gsl3078 [Gloeobacter violaceus PCC 7421]|uniref:Gsl3078 protein n=2 Tax=Gloeobacter violaceus TaxID=33072 RepID=Q7NCA1_GLOVI|nr:gsl3078 [Gloeobacter violaceus PCC 7421]
MQIATFKEVHRSKAVIHTYLAWCDEPGYPLGKAITSQSLQPQTSIARKFTDWLVRLFE